MASKEDVSLRLKLERAAQFKRDASQAGDGIRKIGKDARWTAAGLRVTTNGLKSLRLQGSLMTGRLVHGFQAAGLAAGAFGLYAIKTGVQFNATMQQNNIAFTQLLGS